MGINWPNPYFAALIKEKREAAGLSQKEMAVVIRCHRNTYHNIENGNTEPSFSQGLKLVQFFRLDQFKVIGAILNG